MAATARTLAVAIVAVVTGRLLNPLVAAGAGSIIHNIVGELLIGIGKLQIVLVERRAETR
jgi:hypothetical protein